MKKNLHIIIISLLFSFVLWVSISLSNDYYATFDIPVKLVDFAEGYTTGTEIPKTISVKLKGKGWKLIAVNLSSENEYIVPAGNESGRKFVNLFNFLIENQWLSSDVEVIDISPDTLSFFVEKIASKKVAIVPDLDLKFKPGYGLATKINISPDSTIVYGPASIINTMYSVPTEKIELENIDEKINDVVQVKELQGMSYSNSSVSITIDVQKIVDKEVPDIPVEVLDVPADREVVLLPNKISVGIRGGIDILGKVDSKMLRAYTHYRDIVLDTLGSIKPRTEIPENTSLLFTKPERLRYVIKKFN
jgi:YbbR domain-containing protein